MIKSMLVMEERDKDLQKLQLRDQRYSVLYIEALKMRTIYSGNYCITDWNGVESYDRVDWWPTIGVARNSMTRANLLRLLYLEESYTIVF